MAKKTRRKSSEKPYPGPAFPESIHGETPRELTKREQELARARESGHAEGFAAATRQFKYGQEEQALAFKKKREELHLDTLRTIRDLASAYGQMMGEIARAMQSEKDQL